MMLDAYQHISGTCYRNYHGQNDFIYDFTASQTLDGPISWLSHGSNVGCKLMMVQYFELQLYMCTCTNRLCVDNLIFN